MMRAQYPVDSHPNSSKDAVAARRPLIGLLLFNAIGAVFGGIGLLTDSIGMPQSLLDDTPFDSYAVPAWILLVIVGGSSLVAAAMLLWRSRFSGHAAIIAGVVLLGWIVVEFIMIPAGWLLQLVFLAVALVILWLARPGWAPGW